MACTIALLCWVWSRLDIELTDGTVLLAKPEVPEVVKELEPFGILSQDVNPDLWEQPAFSK
jgi:hypothetical protein